MTDKSLLTNLNTSSSDIIQNHALENAKAIHYLINGKRDSEIKAFTENKVYNLSDLKELNRKISEKFHTLKVCSLITGIVVNLSDRQVREFNNWMSFEQADWDIVSTCQSIILEWEVLVIFPNQANPELPQKHSLRIRIGSGLRPHELIQVMLNGAEDHELVQAMSEMVLKVDYVNTTLGNELKSIVNDWHSSLMDNRVSSKAVRRLLRHRGKLELSLMCLCLIPPIVLIDIFVNIFAIGAHIPNHNVLLKYIVYATSAASLWMFIFYKIASFLTNKILDNSIRTFSPNPQIELTKGDKNLKNKIETANSKILKDLLFKIVVAVILNIGTAFLFKLVPQMWGSLIGFLK